MAADNILFQSEYLTMRLEHEGKLVRVIRSAVPWPSPEAAQHAFASIITLCDRIGRQGRCLLSDMRLAPGRNDPTYETLLAQIRLRLMVGFDRVGTLVQTKVGMLQLSRHIREDRLERMAASDENEILIYLNLKKP